MTIEQLREEYGKYEKEYQSLQKEAEEFVRASLEKISGGSHVSEIKQRPSNKIKDLSSLEENFEKHGKYHEYESIGSIKDIAGIRVVCHCEDDSNEVANFLEGELAQTFFNVESEIKGGENNTGKSKPSYRAIHLTFTKPVKTGTDLVHLYCEIQVRTVMADAWAVQDRKYIYGKQKEGEVSSVTDAVADIMKGCEQLWSLVKKKSMEADAKGASTAPRPEVGQALVHAPQALSIPINDWMSKNRTNALAGLAKVGLKSYMEVEAIVHQHFPDKDAEALREAARSSTIHTFGWPIAVFLGNREEFSPKPSDHGIQAEIAIEENGWSEDSPKRRTYDYWTIHNNAAFYFLGSLFEDSRTENQVFFNTRVIRIVEVFMYLRNLYTHLGLDKRTPIQVTIKHSHLKGRVLTSSSTNRSLHSIRTCSVEDVSSTVVTTLSEIDDQIVDLTEKTTKPLFEKFDFFKLDKKVLEEIVLSYVDGKIV